MKRLLKILLVISIVSISAKTIISNLEEGTFITIITLGNGESIKLDETFDWRTFSPIIQDKSHDLNKSAIIASFETEKHNFLFIDKYINRVQEGRSLGYWNILNFSEARITDYGYVEGLTWGSEFSDYYHSLFQNKSCRNLMFYAALDIVENMCQNLPNDFVDKILFQLDELIVFTQISTYYKTNFSYKDSYWKGFVHRRVETDNVPLSEIHSYLVEARNKISRIDQSNLDDALYEIKINNEIQILLSSKGYLVMKDSKKLHYTFDSPIQSIKYLEDNSGGYYLIEGDNFRDLFDDELNPIN